MKKTALCLAALLALSTIQIALAQSAARSKVDPAEWAPADAVVYIGITDIDRTWKDFKKTAAYEIMNDQALAEAVPSFDLVGTLVEKLQERLAKALDVPPAQLKMPFRGPVTLYVAAPRGAGPEDIQPGLVACVGDAKLMKKYYDTAVGKLKEISKHDSESAGAQTIDVFTSVTAEEEQEEEQEEEDFDEFDEFGGGMDPFGGMLGGLSVDDLLDKLFSAESMPETLAMCLTEDRLIVATSPEQVKAALRLDKSSRTLADADDHKALLRHLKPIGTVRLLVNLPRLIDVFKAKAGGESDAEELQKWLKALGAESLRSLVGHLRVGAASYDSKFELLFLMSGQRSGVAKILSMENRSSAPPPSVAATTCVYAGCNLDIPKLLEDIERMLRQESPEVADRFRAGLEAAPVMGPGSEPVNLLKEFLDHLTAPLTVTLGFTKPLGPNCVRSLLTLGHRDQNAMVRFFSSNFPMLQQRDVRGTQVFDEPSGFTLAPTADRLLAGSSAAVESALEPTAGEPLAETDAWRQVARFVPEKTWFTLYIDQRKMSEAVLELADKQEELMAGGGPDSVTIALMWLLQRMSGGMGGDPEQARKLLRYSAPKIFTIATTPEGVRITNVGLKPED